MNIKINPEYGLGNYLGPSVKTSAVGFKGLGPPPPPHTKKKGKAGSKAWDVEELPCRGLGGSVGRLLGFRV